MVSAIGLGAMSFQWQFENGTGYVDLAGGGSQVLAVPDGLRGLRIRARVSYVDGRGHAESVLSPAVRVPTSRAGAPPVKKALSGKRGGRATAKVVWGAPAYSGGLRITGYKVTAVKVLRGGKSGAPLPRSQFRPWPRSSRGRPSRLWSRWTEKERRASDG